MRLSTLGHGLLIGCLVSCALTPSFAQSVTANVARLNAARSDTAKERAFLSLLSHARAQRVPVCAPEAQHSVRTVLISLLERENALIHNGKGAVSESEMEFYANLIGCVASMKDARALAGLVGALETGWGAINGLVALGDAAVPAVLVSLKDSTRPLKRHAAAHAAGRLARGSDGSAIHQTHRTSLREALARRLQDRESFVRLAAVKALGVFAGDDLRHQMQEIASSDPAVRTSSSGRTYPVREAAREWLKIDSARKPAIKR